jgi:signal transduction histidine kinase/CheY-like chemotaxis protein
MPDATLPAGVLTPPMAAPPAAGDVFAGGGEMGALMRAKDWSRTPLGGPEYWPQSLRTSISILLEARFPMVVAWGPEFRFFYNDGYRQILGKTKHPAALGTPGAEIFPEVWAVVGPEFERVRRGESFAVEDWLLPLDRNGYLENCWFTLSYSPIRDESGGVGGLLAVVAETTGRVEGERRMAMLRELARRTSDAKSPREVCETAAAVFHADPMDVPFSLAYLLDATGERASLVACSDVATGTDVAPREIDLRRASDIDAGSVGDWPLRLPLGSRQLEVLEDLPSRFGALPGGPHPEPAHTAVLLPLARPGAAHAYGVLVLGVSPRRALDERYRDFYELVAEHVVAGIANATAYEEERKRAEALAELDRAKTAFFSNVSHEFRTPLTLMLGPVEDLLGGAGRALPPPAREELATAHRNALRLLKLVNGLLDFTRIESGRVQAVYEPVDLSAMTIELAGMFRSAVERAGLHLVVDCAPLPEPVYVDREMWEKIVLNLLSNALKFTFDGEIGVYLRPTGGAVELEVRDTGIGVAEHELPRLFERFHRVQDAASRTHEGTGIGLALVRDLVRLHGGDVTVESALGRGTSFRATVRMGTAHLPSNQIGAQRDRASTAIRAEAFVEEALRWLPEAGAVGVPNVVPNAVPDVPAGAARILVVDDNADMRAYVARLLRGAYVVDTAADGEDALAHVERQLPDLILADVMMPRLDGFGLLAALRARERTRTLPVILLSARAGEESTVEGLRAGADDYLVKPFAAQELQARVRTHLELARIRAEAMAERERLIEHLESERRRLVEITDRAPAVIAVLRGPQHVFEAANPAYRAMVGDRALIGRPVREVFPELDGQPYFDLLDRVWATGEPYVGTEARVLLRRTSGAALDEVFVNFVYQPLFEPDGRVSGIYVHGVEVTDQVRARREIDQLYQHVREANASKTQFLAAMSHELRTPLNAILGYTDLLTLGVRGPITPTQREDLDRIQNASRYLLSLINDILNFTRVEAGQVDFHIEAVDVAALLAQARELVVQPLEAKGLRLLYRPPSEAVTVRADAERAQQVLLNLLTNATKFTEAGGTVSLDCTVAADTVRIHVRDTGRGIPADQLERIFEPFVQVERSRGRESQHGVGLGLAISRDLARQMGGDLTVESTFGRGSTFTITLPRADPPAVGVPDQQAQ